MGEIPWFALMESFWNDNKDDDDDDDDDDDGAPPSERAYEELCGPSVFVDRLSYPKTVFASFQ